MILRQITNDFATDYESFLRQIANNRVVVATNYEWMWFLARQITKGNKESATNCEEFFATNCEWSQENRDKLRKATGKVRQIAKGKW